MISEADSSDPRVRLLTQMKQMQDAASARYPVPTTPEPSRDEITTWCEATPQFAKATDGCNVELDGVCAHGYPSWLIMYGLVADPNAL
ncbi:hypothetical protein Acid345_4271 [Candidatus Koribacter versatilis Ellin345]|uniref:Uncharacterized protein n=1 Tax=Koribacter versatilis (strain Ellin345) TaxID=204669 RepID=Q1IIM9_KORVE|nr:hypothetical protein [Candidatus Koribacter versatilis]ABF43271.1 hypothetical protein Acid345_4271 [Candidatus Koribacter versatilis Ellin345]